ncbi:hypothetical protein L861_01240 [Litchfieldella anticariensis FP35 = DSM 16096]|uniref:DUF3307 domain-containing protein n=1 Tax=Litchfieldella anticariensis (strain DSM 16096 / CECT 5854 / CIP 108499 / LMG 22089 / FP35) TaxID=1121939 RepID=S2L822_LITA3|nr:DUF3307 domain-containing protein [Halomonas anticariensis]EPC03954.1 hypothetical protein L861_01240 [Halomonas anticariensis FP35 = DSM 16096]
MNAELSLLLGLILAHLVGDFLLQPSHWVEARYRFKERSRQLYFHALIHGLLTFVVLTIASLAVSPPVPLTNALAGALLVMASHALIDLGKAYLSPQRLRWFLLDQALHLLILLGIWLAWLGSWSPMYLFGAWLVTPQVLGIAVTFFLLSRPLSISIALVLRRWSSELPNPGTLIAAGARIGILERFLIAILVLFDQMAAIGFLIAAKSVLRYGELRNAQDRKLTEYVLLGTLLSVSAAVILGLLLRALLWGY